MPPESICPSDQYATKNIRNLKLKTKIYFCYQLKATPSSSTKRRDVNTEAKPGILQSRSLFGLLPLNTMLNNLEKK